MTLPPEHLSGLLCQKIGQLIGRVVSRFLGQVSMNPLLPGPRRHRTNDDHPYSCFSRWSATTGRTFFLVLPVAGIFLNYQSTVWVTYQRYIVVAILVFLGEALLILGLLWQRRKKNRTEKRASDKIAFEKMLSHLSSTFINLPEEHIDATIKKSLGRIANCLNLDRLTLFEDLPGSAGLRATFAWQRDETQFTLPVLRADNFPWTIDVLQRGEVVLIHDRDTLPEAASAEKAFLQKSGALSVAAAPLKAGDEFFGVVSFSSTRRRILWTEDLVGQLKLLAEIFSNALMRKRALDGRFTHATVVQSSDDAIISKSLDGAILAWNASAERLFGFSAAEAVGQPITIIIPDELREEEANILQRLRAGEAIDHYETFRLTKNGKKLQVSLMISPLKDSSGNIVGASKIARDITQQRSTEQALLKSEEQFRLFMDNSPAVAWIKDEHGHYIYISEAYRKQLGVRLEDRCGKTDFEVYPRAIAEALRKNDESALALGHSIEAIEDSVTASGKLCTWLTYKFPFQSTSGQLLVGGIAIDITERKKSEEALHNLTGRLITAQEEERARIGRELHDDICQRLAMLSYKIESTMGPSSVSSGLNDKIIKGIWEDCSQLAGDVQALSHELHSTILDHLGLVAAADNLCFEFSKLHSVRVEFTQRNVPNTLPCDVSLSLYRILQEALRNAFKHSGAKQFAVRLAGGQNEITLEIRDHGIGFDVDRAKSIMGLGLIGMQERVSLLHGTLVIESSAGLGTNIRVSVPLAETGATTEKRVAAGEG